MEGTGQVKAPFLEAKNEDIFSSLLGLIRKRGNVFFWKKGEKEKLESLALNLDEKKREVTLKNKGNLDKWVGQPLCFHFQSIGPQIFGQGELAKGKSFDQVTFTLSEKIFRLEKRQNFRLPVYPQVQCFCQFNELQLKGHKKGLDLPESTHAQNSNGDSTLKIDISHFKDFLTMTSDPDHEYFYGIRYKKFRIHDVSISGLSFVVSEKEISLFESDQPFEKYLLVMNKTQWTIENGRIAYIRKVGNSTHASERVYKIGLQHLKLEHAAESGIGRFINDSLRSGEFNQVYEDWMGIK